MAIAAPPFSGLTQNWDKNLPSGSRFTALEAFHNQAVRDNNTGLVWEHAPDGTPRTFENGIAYCVNKTVGGTAGWRLPSVIELKSLQDPTLAAPFFPTHVFVFVGFPSSLFWSASTVSTNSIAAWVVAFGDGNVLINNKANSASAWCVRGPMQESVY